MQIIKLKTRCQSARRWLSLYYSAQVVPAASMSGLLLTLVAVIAGALGVWRVGADPGWTGRFFVSGGMFSRYQFWFAAAICAQTSAFILNRWVANQVINSPAIAA